MRASLLVLLLLASSSSAGPVLVDRVVAIVDGELVFQSRVERRASLRPGPKDVRRARAELIDELLIAKDAHTTPSEEEVDRALETIMKDNQLDRPTLEAELKRQGLSLSEYRGQLRTQLLEMRWLMARANGASLKTTEAIAALREQLLAPLRKRAVIEVFE